MRKGRRRNERAICDLHMVINLVPFLESSQNRSGILHGRFIHHHRLETPCQRRILFDVLPVLIKRCRPDTMEFASCEHWLQHVSGIHGAIGLTSPDNQMQLIDKENNLPLAL